MKGFLWLVLVDTSKQAKPVFAYLWPPTPTDKYYSELVVVVVVVVEYQGKYQR